MATLQLQSKLIYREREVFGLLAANGATWTPDTKLARITLKFDALIHRLRARGVRIQTFNQGKAQFYRLTPPVPRPTRPASFVLSPMSRRRPA